jgi:hypothetical protein
MGKFVRNKAIVHNASKIDITAHSLPWKPEKTANTTVSNTMTVKTTVSICKNNPPSKQQFLI